MWRSHLLHPMRARLNRYRPTWAHTASCQEAPLDRRGAWHAPGAIYLRAGADRAQLAGLALA